MYCYEIGGIGFGFDIDRPLTEYSPYDVFRISEEEFLSLSERHHYTFLPEIKPHGTLVHSESSRDIFVDGDEVFHVNKRFDEKSYDCIFSYKRGTSGGSFSFTNGGIDCLKVTAELFRSCNFVSALLNFDAMILHSSFVICDGQAVLFTAPSGGGKSTQAQLWEQYKGARIINGDRAVIKKCGDGWYVYSLPLCGSSGICLKRSAKLAVTAVVEKSADDAVLEMSNAEKLTAVFPQITVENYKPQEFAHALDLEDAFIRECGIVKLKCTPTDKAVTALEKYIKAL